MQFRSASPNQKYTLVPYDRETDQYGRVTRRVEGTRIEFQGKGEGFFDSEAQRWDDETRLKAERHLLGHPDFRTFRYIPLGGPRDHQPEPIRLPVLDLAPGQEIPAEHAEFVKECRWYQIEQEIARSQAGQAPVSAAPAVAEPELGTQCMFRTLADGSGQLVECSNPRADGDFYCEQHLAKLADAVA